jgi:hypothetical protein
VPRHPRLLFQFLGSIRHLVGLLGGGISPAQGIYLHRITQHRKTQTKIHAPRRIRTCDPNVRAAEDSTCLRALGHWDRQLTIYLQQIRNWVLIYKYPWCSKSANWKKSRNYTANFSVHETIGNRTVRDTMEGGGDTIFWCWSVCSLVVGGLPGFTITRQYLRWESRCSSVYCMFSQHFLYDVYGLRLL